MKPSAAILLFLLSASVSGRHLDASESLKFEPFSRNLNHASEIENGQYDIQDAGADDPVAEPPASTCGYEVIEQNYLSRSSYKPKIFFEND